MMRFKYLFKTGRIGTLETKNRIIMSPMNTLLCEENGKVNEKLISWYVRRAKGGAGLINVEITQIATAIDPLKILPCVLRADDDRFIPGLKTLADAVHRMDAKIGIQLTPGGGAQSKGGPWNPRAGEEPEPVSPSGIAAFNSSSRPRALTIEEIEKILDSCGEAARRVQRAGFDLIQIHAHGGYLIAQFLSPYFNKRTDRYGGNLDNRDRFLIEIIAAIRKAIGSDFPLTVKYSIDEFIKGGRDVEDSKRLAKKLEERGVDGIDISAGVFGARIPASPPYFLPRGVLVPLAQALKDVVNIPVSAIGRLNDPRMGEKVLKEGKADFIALGRALIADPDWPQKAASGKIQKIRPCLACNECRQQLFWSSPVRCAVNAVAGREGELDQIDAAQVKKKVLVVGSGPAGMEAARIAALRGNRVILFERKRVLGGLMVLGGVLNGEITEYLKWMKAQLKKLSIETRLKTEITSEAIDKIKPDVVILATGGTFPALKVPGIGRNNVFSGQDFLNLVEGIPGRKTTFLNFILPFVKHFISPFFARQLLGFNFPIKKKVVIIGGQFPGCTLALALAKKGKKVTIIEESEQYGSDVENYTMVALNYEIEAGNITVLTSMKVAKITDEGVVILDKYGNKSLREADTVLLAQGLRPSDSDLAEALTDKAEEIYTIGDAKSFHRIMGAVSQGYVTGYHL
jgi:2,4-dienoyl-CoA reductase-like NADH-dependent reductase (Old Yellow Enzyme family)/thioredoxin reductase